MENNSDAASGDYAEISRWVAGRLAMLTPGSDFQPDIRPALGRLRRLRERESRRELLRGWTVVLALGIFLVFFALPAPRAAFQRSFDSWYGGSWYSLLQQGAPLPGRVEDARPEYSGAQLIRPTAYREWIYLSSGLGMEYNAAAGGPENFTNVFVPQWAYRAFLESGKWPDKTMFALESRASETKGSINKSGHFQSDMAGLAIEVKDETRFADKWAYFSFGSDKKTAMAMTGPADQCWQCHDRNAAVEHTFVQFYPTLKPVAMKFGTYRAQAE